jgi:hypothetical protein
MSPHITACPPPRPLGPYPDHPDPSSLTCNFTLTAGPMAARIARRVARHTLTAHGLADTLEAVEQVVGELTAAAWRFTTTPDLYVSVKYRDHAVRVIVYDGHPRHENPRLAALCDAHRTRALRVLAAVVKSCRGTWGIGDARDPSGGTRTWAVLPHTGATAYAEPERPYRRHVR